MGEDELMEGMFLTLGIWSPTKECAQSKSHPRISSLDATLADKVNLTSIVFLNLKIKNLLIYQIEKCERFVTSLLVLYNVTNYGINYSQARN